MVIRERRVVRDDRSFLSCNTGRTTITPIPNLVFITELVRGIRCVKVKLFRLHIRPYCQTKRLHDKLLRIFVGTESWDTATDSDEQVYSSSESSDDSTPSTD